MSEHSFSWKDILWSILDVFKHDYLRNVHYKIYLKLYKTSLKVNKISLKVNKIFLKLHKIYFGTGVVAIIYGSWIYNKCLSPLELWVRTRSWRGVLDTTLCDRVCQWLATGRWFSSGTPVSSTNITDRHSITEILLKVALISLIRNDSILHLIPVCK